MSRRVRRKFNPFDWCGAIQGKQKGISLSSGAPVNANTCWFAECLPTYNQTGPSCVGQAWANWLELMLRRYVGARIFIAPQQISGEMIWKKAREMFYNGDLTGGLQLPEGFEAMKELGLIPNDSVLMNIKPDWNSVGFALLSTPVVQAHHIHSGWANPNPENGCIDHSGHPTVSDGYHATLRVGQIRQNGAPFYVSQNSWGMDWGWKGLFCMTSTEDAEGLMPGALYTANMPSGWTSWEGWKKGIIEC